MPTIWMRLLEVVDRDRRERRLADEIQSHLDHLADEHDPRPVARGGCARRAEGVRRRRSNQGAVSVILGIGMTLGALLSAGTGPLVSSMVLGVSPRDPSLVVAIAALLAAIALVSCVGPIRRSLRVDPLVALREE